jgi:hypothetical protein
MIDFRKAKPMTLFTGILEFFCLVLWAAILLIGIPILFG